MDDLDNLIYRRLDTIWHGIRTYLGYVTNITDGLSTSFEYIFGICISNTYFVYVFTLIGYIFRYNLMDISHGVPYCYSFALGTFDISFGLRFI